MSSAHYRLGARCLPNTRVALLEDAGLWFKKSDHQTTAWVYGYAGSGKSALTNSIAKNLEDASIPFTVFTCKRDDTERPDVQHILPTICYDLTQFYDDYRGTISNIVDQPTGRSISTGDVASQSELLFGCSPTYNVISPMGARRAPIHVILIDALDECRNSRQRSALAEWGVSSDVFLYQAILNKTWSSARACFRRVLQDYESRAAVQHLQTG